MSRADREKGERALERIINDINTCYSLCESCRSRKEGEAHTVQDYLDDRGVDRHGHWAGKREQSR